MAFWGQQLEQLGGFDPIFDAAADDLDFEWRLAQTGSQLAYHPAALVWHHRRPGLRRYLRQQASYGRSHAFLEHRYPERFPSYYRVRQAARQLRRGRGNDRATRMARVRYLTLPHDESALILLAHQWGMPAAIALGWTAPLGLLRRKLVAPAATAAGFAAALFVVDAVLAGRGRRRSERTLALRTQVALFRMLRPLAFRWGHVRGRREARAAAPTWPPPPTRSEVGDAPRSGYAT
jgi:hypothetical protein